MEPADVGYRGLWRRRLLRDANGEDSDTQVWWLQGDDYYVDLRIPPDRPDFSGVAGFEQCNGEQLAWLARQQGFAGRLEIDGRRLQWQRTIDFQPPADVADIGDVRWDGDCLHEQGVLSDYAEEWLWERPASPVSGVWATPDGRGLRLAVGDWFMQAVDRRPPLPPGARLAGLLTDAGPSSTELLACAIDFGRVGGWAEDWLVQHSSQPWREGKRLVELDEQPTAWFGQSASGG